MTDPRKLAPLTCHRAPSLRHLHQTAMHGLCTHCRPTEVDMSDCSDVLLTWMGSQKLSQNILASSGWTVPAQQVRFMAHLGLPGLPLLSRDLLVPCVLGAGSGTERRGCYTASYPPGQQYERCDCHCSSVLSFAYHGVLKILGRNWG